jgi:predicted transcriptional regulator
MTPMTSTTFTIRVDAVEKQRLEALAKSTGRSRSYLAADAIRAYLDVQEWQVAGVRSALQSLAEQGGAEHSDVKSWVASWGEASEAKRPKPRRR